MSLHSDRLLNIDESLNDLKEKIDSVKKSTIRIRRIDTLIQKIHDTINLKYKNLERSHKEIIKSQGGNVNALFKSVMGKSEEQLEKERQAYYQSAIEYNDLIKELEILNFEKEILERKIREADEGKTWKDEYETLLKFKEQKLAFSNQDASVKLKAFNAEIQLLKNRLSRKDSIITNSRLMHMVLKGILHEIEEISLGGFYNCLLYTSDAADD